MWCYKLFYIANHRSNDNNYNFHNTTYDKDRKEGLHTHGAFSSRNNNSLILVSSKESVTIVVAVVKISFTLLLSDSQNLT
jgi:hypothetical protein